MKKQLLIAAVAATMTSVAIADISITGGMKANYKSYDNAGVDSNTITTETDLQVTGKTGGTTVYRELNTDSAADGITSDNFDVEDVWMKTSIAGATVKAGTWNGSDSLVSRDSDRSAGRFEVSTAVSGVTVIVDGNATGNKNITLKGDVAGVAVSYKIDDNDADEYKIATTMQGVSVAYHNVDAGNHADTGVAVANSGKSSLLVSGSVQGFELSYAQAKTDSAATIDGDSYFGDTNAFQTGMTANDDISGFGISTSLAGNTVSAKSFTVDNSGATADQDFTKLTVTRPLAGGATLEVQYTDEDGGTTDSSKETFDVELAVKF